MTLNMKLDIIHSQILELLQQMLESQIQLLLSK